MDHSNKQLPHDLTNKVDHVYNQSDYCKNDDNKLWTILMDSKSTCNVIIKKNLLTNIRKFECKLKLHTQTGECYIDQIGQMKGVGKVWYYLKGVANIISQFIMALHSRWDIEYRTKNP